jgi:hypothetical protein
MTRPVPAVIRHGPAPSGIPPGGAGPWCFPRGGAGPCGDSAASDTLTERTTTH